MIGSDLLVQQLEALEIEYIALNPGATLRGLHESLLNGDANVKPITTLHEGVAVGMAHGYAKARGKPMAVGLHDTVGVLNAALAVHNAWADEVPMLIVGGVGPIDAPARRAWIDWVHTTSDTPRPIRDSLVWAETPGSLPGALLALRRAHQRARSQPAGPAYVGIDTSLQLAETTATAALPSLPPWRVGPDPQAVERAARRLSAATSPTFVLDRPLDGPAAAALIKLAEHLGAGLVELEGASNTPWGHPLDRSADGAVAIAQADVVLAVDVRDLGLARGLGGAGSQAADTYWIEASSAPLRESSWVVSASDPAEALQLVGDPGTTLEALLEHVLASSDGVAAERTREATDPAPEQAAIGRESALDKRTIAVVAGAVLPHERVIVAHGALGGHAREQLRLRHPSQYLGRSGGEGLGYALPAALGVALAYRGSDRVVVAFLTDGDTLYLPGALWTAAHEGIPLLAIIENNRSYWRDEIHQRDTAAERGRDPALAASGVRLTAPAVDLAAMARSLGVQASSAAHTSSELEQAIRQGLEVVSQGHPFVIEAITAQPGDD